MNINEVWFAKPDDLVGGWAVMNCDKTPGNADLAGGDRMIGSFIDEETARHMIRLHNRWLYNTRLRSMDD